MALTRLVIRGEDGHYVFAGTREPGWGDWQIMTDDDKIGAAFCVRKLEHQRGAQRKGAVCRRRASVQQRSKIIPARTVRCLDCFLEEQLGRVE